MKNVLEKIKKFFRYFFTLKDTPHSIAAGAALGILLGILPGEGVATALILVTLLKFNRASATAGVLATNMWSTVAAAPLATAVGGFLFGAAPGSLAEQFDRTYRLGLKFFLSKAIFFDLALPLIAGFAIVAGAISIVFYFSVYFMILKYQKEKQQ